MKSKQCFLYATKEDLVEIFLLLESSFKIKYAEAGLLNDKVSCFYSFKNIETLGTVEYGDWNNNKKYLILNDDYDLVIRDVVQKNGELKYAVDQMKNENSIVFYIGGVFQNNALIASKIGLINESSFTTELFKKLLVHLKKNFVNIKGFYVSRTALEESKKGLRLTTDAKSSSDYDLIIE